MSLHCIQVFAGHKQMLESRLCDVVVVSTPNMTHYEILMDIINHPKPHHVLVEKPLCTNVSDCQKVSSISTTSHSKRNRKEKLQNIHLHIARVAAAKLL